VIVAYQQAINRGGTLPAAIDTDITQRLRAVLGRLARVLRPTEAGLAAGLTPTRAAVLLSAVRHGPVRLAVIAEHEGLNPTMLSRTVGKLVADGLLVRSADSDDRRSAWIGPTARGAALAEQIRTQRTNAVERALEQLAPDDRWTLEAAVPALERLAQRLTEAQR